MFERRFPADFICEAIDQTRGWFYSLLAVNTLVFGHTPYRNVVCLGLLLDQDGQKMSKSRGNIVDPRAILESRGADALRWNMFSVGSPWVPRRVNLDNIDESTRRFLLTLWNTYSFFVTYARLDGWDPGTAAAAGTDARARPLDPLATRRDRFRSDRRALRLRRAERRAGARGVRRRALELVCAALATALLEVVGPDRARNAARVPHDGDVAARALLPVRHRRDARQPRGQYRVGAPRRLAGRRRRTPRRRARRGDGPRTRAHVARAFRAQRREDRRAPAAAARVRRCCRRTSRCATKWSPRSRPSST